MIETSEHTTVNGQSECPDATLLNGSNKDGILECVSAIDINESNETTDIDEKDEKLANGHTEHDVSIALHANDVEAVPGLLKEITTFSESFQKNDEEARLQLMAKAKTLWQALETPRETMIRHCWAQPSVMAALTAGTDRELWSYLARIDGPFKVADIAEAKNIDPPLLARLLRHISAMGYLTEIDADTYQLTNFTRSMAFPFINAGYPCVSGACLNALGKFHEWGNLNDWKDPTDIANSPLQHGYSTKLTFFEHLHTNQPYGQQFHLHMGGYRQGRPAWMDGGFFPVQEKLIEGFEKGEESALLVDVGGSFGHDIGEFHRKYPNAPGRLILEDLPVVIDQITELDDKIERLKYDFFTEQPIKGARAYYMHSVLHDWSDETCIKILKAVMGAMKPGYSRILINENVIPSTGAQWEATALDIMMLTLLASRERTRENWETLLSAAGLRICNIWSVANGVESLIECELA
ncbi:Fc.00g024100.m01.CDS01 [Cosmosporella sp. VM-42]